MGKGLNKQRQLLVTSALPYANGPIHLGHLVETIQTDIWVRFQKLCAHEAYYFCADDTHGAPIMIAAQKAGKTPEEFVAEIHADHSRDFSGFFIEFDNYYTTNSPENKGFSEFIYNSAVKKGHIARKTINQLFSNADGMFLPDRYVKGTCPKCKSPDQYGDSCEVCGSTYAPTELIDPRSAVSGDTPVLKESEHLFFKLADFQSFLEKWLKKGASESIRKKLDEWLKDGLRDWDISRDGPYFGFAIPGENNKYFYVWLDAPIGYMASSKNFFEKRDAKKWDYFWKEGKGEIHHFIGKDIVYFHTLFWPALLEAGDFAKPAHVHVHGFLTVNGEKMSKSRGTLVRGSTYLKHLEPEALRFFYASKLGPGLDDLDLSRDDFVARWNADVVGNITNIYSRLCGGILSKLELKLSRSLSKEGEALMDAAVAGAERAAKHYDALEYTRVVREAAAIADSINRFVAEKEPWKQIKTAPEDARQTCTDALNAARVLAGLIKPILPSFVQGVENLLAIQPVTFQNLSETLPSDHVIHAYRNLAGRIEPEDFDRMLQEEEKTALASAPAKAQTAQGKPAGSTSDKSAAPAQAGTAGGTPDGIITIDDLARVELRAGRITKAELVEGADKLLRVELDIGEAEPRQVFAGIRAAYKPEDLADLMVVCVANLLPRKMKFGISSAMLLASGEGPDLTLYTAHRKAKPGDRLK